MIFSAAGANKMSSGYLRIGEVIFGGYAGSVGESRHR